MLKFRNAAIGVGLLAASTLGAGAAVAAPMHGYVTAGGLNLRAGPGTDYPAVVTMRGGDAVTIFGCLSGWSWCDIDWYGNRGWAAGQYIQVTYQGYRRPIMSYGYAVAVPFLSFSIGPYWDQHYRHRRFFGEMGRYEGRHREDQGPPHMSNPPDHKPPFIGSPPNYQPLNGGKPPKYRLHKGESPNYAPPAMNQAPDMNQPSHEGKPPKFRRPHMGESPNFAPSQAPTLHMDQPHKDRHLHMNQPPKGPTLQMNQPPKGQMHLNEPPKGGRHGNKCKPDDVAKGACQ